MKTYTLLRKEILNWYQRYGRDLPWRKTTDPYAIMVSEIMLQQTQADRVKPKYEAWLKRFPSVEHLAKAPAADVIRAWAGLGYNRRALYLQQAAQALAQLDEFPSEIGELQNLPGIGPYTAAAICSFAFNQDVALVDTNIKRIYELLVLGDRGKVSEKEVHALAEQFLPKGRSRDWHNALMDIGSVIAKQRGAKAQQIALITLFPILRAFPLPEVTEAPLARPKQSHYKTSRRYWRGKLVQYIREHEAISDKELSELFLDCPYGNEEIVVTLVKDGLIARHGTVLRLA